MVKFLIVVLQNIKVESYDAILVVGSALAFLGLFEHLAKQVRTKSSGAAAELIEIRLAAKRVNWFCPDGRCEMHLG